jgi:biopolymer transport protein ExbD
MRLRSHAYAGSESDATDLAPMLDFVVNLLIFFIITAVFVKHGSAKSAASRSRRRG